MSLLTSLSPDKLPFDQNCLLFINISSIKDSWYKCLVIVHTLTGREYHSVNTHSTLLASLHATTVKATKNLQHPRAHKSRHKTPLCQEFDLPVVIE